MITKVYIASLSSYSAEKINSLYENIRDNFSGDGRISYRKESLMGRIMLHNALNELGAEEYNVRYIADEKPFMPQQSQANSVNLLLSLLTLTVIRLSCLTV